MSELRVAESPADYAAFGELVAEYLDWCRARYADDVWFVERVFGHQALDDEVAALAQRYGPPVGRTLLLCDAEGVLGGGAYRHLESGVCEMKRLFVRERARGRGAGRRLCDALLAAAARDGYHTMRLDTADRLTEAMALYEALGFVRRGPYHDYPEELMPYLTFYERPL